MAIHVSKPDTGSETAAILDAEALDVLAAELQADAAPGLLANLVETFARDARSRSARMAEAAAAADLAILEHEAHTLGSSAATFGAMALHRLARDIEAACLAPDPSRAAMLTDGVMAAAEAAIGALEEYLTQQRMQT